MPPHTIKKDVAVIGGGPGGYVAAIRLGQLGKSVVLIEKESLGGVCLNWGCIPSKALIHAAKTYGSLANAEEMGITVTNLKIDLKKTQEWKREIVKKLTGGISQLLKTSGAEIIRGTAKFETANRLTIQGANSGNITVEFSHAIVSTGSRPMTIPGFEMDGINVVDSKEALEWTRPPKRLLVIGGGVIGLEIGMLYQKFGTELTVVEMMDQLLPGVDPEIAQTMERVLKKKKSRLFLRAKALGYQKRKSGLEVSIETPKGKETVECDVILLSAGRIPNGLGLGLEKIGVNVTPKGVVSVNKRLQTNVPNIFAIGDVSGPPLLAHKASKEGLVASEIIAGHPEEYDVRAMPGAIFTDPEIATVGLTEAQAKAEGFEAYSSKFPFAASGRALAAQAPEGFVKIVGDRKTGRLLGVHMIGLGASDLISEAALAIEMGASVEDVALTVHPHPTLPEAVMEAAEAFFGRAIHTINPKPAAKERKYELT